MAAGATYEPIATYTFASTIVSYTFTSIPQTYTDLVIAGTGTTGGACTLSIQFNGDTAANYVDGYLIGTSSPSVVSGVRGGVQAYLFNWTATQGTLLVNIQNYANTSTYKTIVNRGGTTADVWQTIGLWKNTNAITSVTLNAVADLFQVGSIFTIYGIAAA